MAVNNTLAPKKESKPTFNQSLMKPAYQEMINNAFRDSKKAEQFVTAVLSLVQQTPALEECEHRTVVTGALQGITLKLNPSPSLGEFWLVPREKSYQDENGVWHKVKQANFQLGLAGRLQLAYRSGLYVDIDTAEVVEGEYKGLNKNTKRPVVEFISNQKDRQGRKVIGYFAYYILKDTGGYLKTEYLSYEDALEKAKKSDAFSLELYERYINGEVLSKQEQRKVQAPWYKYFSRMAQNACLRELLRHAPKSVEQAMGEGADNTSFGVEQGVEYEVEEEPDTTVIDEFFNGTKASDISDEKTTLKKSAKKTEQMSLLDDNK